MVLGMTYLDDGGIPGIAYIGAIPVIPGPGIIGIEDGPGPGPKGTCQYPYGAAISFFTSLFLTFRKIDTRLD